MRRIGQSHQDDRGLFAASSKVDRAAFLGARLWRQLHRTGRASRPGRYPPPRAGGEAPGRDTAKGFLDSFPGSMEDLEALSRHGCVGPFWEPSSHHPFCRWYLIVVSSTTETPTPLTTFCMQLSYEPGKVTSWERQAALIARLWKLKLCRLG